MLFARSGLAVALVVLSTTAPTVAQPVPVKGVPVPPVATLLTYVGDENIQKELKLSPDQTRKLLAHRQKVWDETWITAPKDADNEATTKAIDAEFKAVLSAEQFQRANQLAVQHLWANGGNIGGFGDGNLTTYAPDPRTAPATILRQFPAIADALKLDESQKKLLSEQQNRFGMFVYLSPEQTAAVKALFGAAYKGTYQAQYDPRSANGFGGGGGRGQWFRNMPPALYFTAAKDVQVELKLSEDQLKALAGLRLKWNAPTGFKDLRAISPAARKKAQDDLYAETEAALNKLLTADQRTRIEQIEHQQQSTQLTVFNGPSSLSKDLGITDDQRKRYQEANAAHGEAVLKAVLSGEPFEKVRAVVAAADKDRDAAVEAILTAEQKTKQKELLGVAFTGRAFPDAGLGSGGPAQLQRKLGFGRHVSFAFLLRYPKVQEELKLTEEQVKKLTELSQELATKFPQQPTLLMMQDETKADKFYADRSAFVEKSLADVLSKEQQTRYRELNLQRLEARVATGPAGFATAVSYPGVAEAVKLTADQKKKLLDNGRPTEVLSDEQKKLIARMLGKPANVRDLFASPDFGPGGAGGTPPLARAHQMILSTLVWDELKLEPEQAAKIARAANAYTLVGPVGFGVGWGNFGGRPVDPKEQAAGTEAFGKAVDATLSPAQRKRLDQLALQQTLVGGLDSALTGVTDVSTALAVTAEQKKQLAAASTEAYQLAGLLNAVNLAWDKEQPARLMLRERLDAALLKELSADQRAKLKELNGEPFAGFAKQPLYGRVGGPGGGFGGGPFGP